MQLRTGIETRDYPRPEPSGLVRSRKDMALDEVQRNEVLRAEGNKIVDRCVGIEELQGSGIDQFARTAVCTAVPLPRRPDSPQRVTQELGFSSTYGIAGNCSRRQPVPHTILARELDRNFDVVRCEELSSTGTEILNFVLFILLSEMGVLRGKPSGFVQVQATWYSDAGPRSDETSRLRKSVPSPEVLRQIACKINVKLLNCGAKNVANGLLYYIGYVWEPHWEVLSNNLDAMVDWLRLTFESLLKTATRAYDAHTTKLKRPTIIKAQEQAKSLSNSVGIFLISIRILQLEALEFDGDVDSNTSQEALRRQTDILPPSVSPFPDNSVPSPVFSHFDPLSP
ncbi:hypothetical protein B0H14DRAFT_3164327 [Mycena olivaceomarginata]|nr:hypothetical protein B0H14DRAFT_3164327 [Mycena olivaceomarginata]